jgi:hypothetical protein
VGGDVIQGESRSLRGTCGWATCSTKYADLRSSRPVDSAKFILGIECLNTALRISTDASP